MATDLVIGIGAEYKGKAAFNKASGDVLGLTKAVKTLAKGYIGLQGLQKAYSLGKVSLNAFLADNAAATQLGKTIQNLGLAYNAVGTEKFIANLQSTTGVLDDQLRPALQSLLIATKDYAKSQELLGLALDISAGTGKDLASVSAALSKAYLGNYASLSRLGGGISKADIASGDFLKIQKELTTTFKGSALSAVQTYAGQMRLLGVATANAKESIGEGLVFALSTVSDGNITALATSIERTGTATEELIVGLGLLANKIKNFPGADLVSKLFGGLAALDFIPVVGSYLRLLQQSGKTEIARLKTQSQGYFITTNTAKVVAKTLTTTKALTAEQAKQLALKKSQAVLDASSKVLDLDLIQNAAALQGKITSDETKRLELQQAILMGNASAAGKLAQELAAAQVAALKAGNTDPFSSWTEGAKSALAALQSVRSGLAGLGIPSAAVPSSAVTPSLSATGTSPSSFSTDKATLDSILRNVDMVGGGGGAGTATKVIIEMAPDAQNFITAKTIENSANGNQNSLSRNGIFGVYGF